MSSLSKHLLPAACLLLLVAAPSRAQLRLGAALGGAWNHYTIDTHYMEDWHYQSWWGGTAGISAQYGFNDWLAVRSDLVWTQKNHRQRRSGVLAGTDFTTVNDYVQIPVLASMSFGGKTVRGFMNVGAYGAYWAASRLEGNIAVILFDSDLFPVDGPVEFNSERDQRLDLGAAGGAGVECRFSRHWAVQMEGRLYYSCLSSQKDYMRIKDPKYNTTVCLQAAVYYIF